VAHRTHAPRRRWLVGLLLLAAHRPAGAQRRARADAWLIAPDGTGALLAPSVDEAALRRRFGARAVRRARLVVEGSETAPGTVLFPDDPSRRLEIFWRDTVAGASRRA
jgi:hypothetical protein